MKLRDDANFIPELNFDMEKEKRIIGQNIFVKEKIVLKDGSKLPVTTMGPIRIANDLKKRGFGIKLLDYSIERTKGYGCKVLFFEGNIQFLWKERICPCFIKRHRLPWSVERDEIGFLSV